MSGVLLYNLVKTLNLDEDDSHFALGFGKIFSLILDARSNNARNQNIDNLSELLKLLILAELGDKVNFSLDFVPV